MSNHPLFAVITKVRKGVESGILCAYEKHDDVIQFRKVHPKLYEMVIQKDCDVKMLMDMLEVHNKVQTGQCTSETGDVSFGQIAADKYVAPLVQDSREGERQPKRSRK